MQAEANGDSAAAGMEAEDNPAKDQAAEFWAALQGKQPENGTAEVRIGLCSSHSFSHQVMPTLIRIQNLGPHPALLCAEALPVILNVQLRHNDHFQICCI